MLDIPDIDTLVSDRKAFDAFVYTPVKEAVIELKKRWEDQSIKIPVEIPDVFKNGFRAVQYVCLITPNYQIRRYVTIADAIDLQPLIFEQHTDKFVPQNNNWKKSLGKMPFFGGLDKNNKPITKYLNIVDFNNASGKELRSVKTLWDQPLIDFHHQLFFKTFTHLKKETHLFDGSEWLAQQGGEGPKKYYEPFLFLFIKHGMLFENFMLDEKELWFTKEVFLPAFIDVYRKTGLKPLIVALQPTEIEQDLFWISHPLQSHGEIIEKNNS